MEKQEVDNMEESNIQTYREMETKTKKTSRDGRRWKMEKTKNNLHNLEITKVADTKM